MYYIDPESKHKPVARTRVAATPGRVLSRRGKWNRAVLQNLTRGVASVILPVFAVTTNTTKNRKESGYIPMPPRKWRPS